MTFSLRYDADLQRLELEIEPASHDEVTEARDSFLSALIAVLDHQPATVDATLERYLDPVEQPEHRPPGFTS